MIHRYKCNGYNIVLDINSGSVHAVDDLVYDIIGICDVSTQDDIIRTMLQKYKGSSEIDEEEIRHAMSDLDFLIEQGKLFSKDEFENQAGVFKNRQSVIKAMCLHISHDCNLACRYCFAGKGNYNGENTHMSFDVGKRAMDFLIENSGTRKNLEVDFFGGEPLMNFDVVKKLVAYGREQEKPHNKSFRFTLTTNGVLLNDDIIEFANREMDNVVLSLDGRREVNDKMRVFKNGRGCYDLILPKFKELAESRGQEKYYIRGTYTHFNTDFANDILHMADLGFKQLSMEPVVAPPDEEYAITDEDVPVLYGEYERLATEMVRRDADGRGFTFFHYMIDLEGGPCILKRISGCGVGTEYIAVTPWGDFYPCHQFVGDTSFILGNIYEGITNTQLQDKFRQCNMYSRPECRDCFARLYCSGGCAANAYHSSGSITGIYDIGCRLHRKRVECAIMIKVAQALTAK